MQCAGYRVVGQLQSGSSGRVPRLFPALRAAGPGSLRAGRPRPAPAAEPLAPPAGRARRPSRPAGAASGAALRSGPPPELPFLFTFPFHLGIRTGHRPAATRDCHLPSQSRVRRCALRPEGPWNHLTATEQSELLLSGDLKFYLKCTFITWSSPFIPQATVYTSLWDFPSLSLPDAGAVPFVHNPIRQCPLTLLKTLLLFRNPQQHQTCSRLLSSWTFA